MKKNIKLLRVYFDKLYEKLKVIRNDTPSITCDTRILFNQRKFLWESITTARPEWESITTARPEYGRGEYHIHFVILHHLEDDLHHAKWVDHYLDVHGEQSRNYLKILYGNHYHMLTRFHDEFILNVREFESRNSGSIRWLVVL